MKTNNTTLQANFGSNWNTSNPWFVQRLPFLTYGAISTMAFVPVIFVLTFGLLSIQFAVSAVAFLVVSLILFKKLKGLATVKVKGSVMIVNYPLIGKKHVVEIQFIRHIRPEHVIGKHGVSFEYRLDGSKHRATLLNLECDKNDLCSQLRALRKAA